MFVISLNTTAGVISKGGTILTDNDERSLKETKNAMFLNIKECHWMVLRSLSIL